jgi:Rha family phage regulatory protein
MTEMTNVPAGAPDFNPQAAVRHALMVIDGSVKTTSRHVAEVFGKQHKDVLKAIDNLDCSEAFGRRNFAPTSYIDAFNREQKLYELTFNGFVRLVMAFTGPKAAAFKEAYIEAFDTMRRQLEAAPQQQLAQQIAQIAAAQLQTDQRMVVLERVIASQSELIDLLKRHQKPERKRLKPLTPDDYLTIRELIAQAMPGAEIARHVGVSQACVSMIKHNQWKWGKPKAVPEATSGPMQAELEV